MKKLFSCFLAVSLLSSVSACSYFNYDGKEPITCYVQITWNDHVFRGRDSAKNIKIATKNATEEACEVACRSDSSCEESCLSDAPLVFSSCRDRRTDSIVEETGTPQLPPPLPHFAQNHHHHPDDVNAPYPHHPPHHLPPLPPPPPAIGDFDPIFCEIQISWQNHPYDGQDDGKSLKRARREAINEACEIACGDDDTCEDNCSKNATVLSSHCIDLRTREVLE